MIDSRVARARVCGGSLKVVGRRPSEAAGGKALPFQSLRSVLATRRRVDQEDNEQLSILQERPLRRWFIDLYLLSRETKRRKNRMWKEK